MAVTSKISGHDVTYDPTTKKWNKPANLNCFYCNSPPVRCLVNIPSNLSHTGFPYWTYKPVDECISDIVNALNSSGVLTRSSCCGHGDDLGHIMLQDGRVLGIFKNYDDFLKYTCDNNEKND